MAKEEIEHETGLEFLARLEKEADRNSGQTDAFAEQFGVALPATLERLGLVLKSLYYAACCAWGCRGGDHQVEWLTGRVVNQAMGSYRLIRAGFYDESLALTRGIGELANLLWLFLDENEMHRWMAAERRERLQQFSPSAVRRKLAASSTTGPPISEERYRRLCEVATHPVPDLPPGQFTGTGRPILGHLLQVPGVLVAATELGFSVSVCAHPLSTLLGLSEERAVQLRGLAIELISSLGSFNILNYEELTTEAVGRNSAASTSDKNDALGAGP